MKINYGSIIESVETFDIRFPTSLEGNGSDAMHSDPDYSVCYVVIKTSDNISGFGMTFTLGKGTNIVCTAVDSMKFLLEKQKLDDILNDFGTFWRKLTSESQLRWVRTSSVKAARAQKLLFLVGSRERRRSSRCLSYHQCNLGSLGTVGRKASVEIVD